jgi:hypothetical protein
MTAQIAEILHYNNQKLSMCSEPLGDYFLLAGVEPQFEANCSALWRGYVGTWEIAEDRLYLVELEGTLKDGTEATLATLFPDFPDRVFAGWFTGKLRVPQGKELEYVHMGYCSVFERDLFIEIEKGEVKNTYVQENGVAATAEAPEGYGVAAMTIFPSKREKKEKKQ